MNEKISYKTGFRTYDCGQLRIDHLNENVTLSGWIQTIRKFGSITFIDLRDRYGITQLLLNEKVNLYDYIVFNQDLPTKSVATDSLGLGREFVIQIKGKVTERSNKNKNLSTGEIEIVVDTIAILNASATPPFTIQDDTDGGDDLRMKYRYLDLRRNAIKKNLELRYAVNRSVRNYMHDNGFMDIETPFLIKSTPEGARDFVVPSRMNAGQFYALPQSPQTFKQLLMISGYDRYFQIVKCFRDEDLRADRQPEFTQIDCEMAFVEQEDILRMFEGLIKQIFIDAIKSDGCLNHYEEITINKIKTDLIEPTIKRISWENAMWNYGNDKPDIRFEIQLFNFKKPNTLFTDKPNQEKLIQSEFKVFNEAETVIGIAVPNSSEYTRKQLDELTEWVKRPQIGMMGLAYIKYNLDGSLKSSVDKFFNESQLKDIANNMNAKMGDLILILAGKEERTRKAMSELRLEMGKRLNLRKSNEYKLLWVLDFPLFEFDEHENRWVARHHPFTAPIPDDIDTMIKNSPKIENIDKYLEHPYYKIKANAYDLVLNGNEIGGGSIRIFKRELQERMFEALGMTKEESEHKFGFLLGAFEFGAPPHGGIAFGFDRICSILGGSESIRDFIAFPKNNSGRDVMLDAPSTIDQKQMTELNIQTIHS